ncbi:MAG: pyridoxamine 5'-phosphate oxidase family protein [Gammaproteobacteria bacterium]|jgi:uncharacterized protein|nr:pyridoxamine 5'-phosphate oxidase family protein [Gammaproteobacteria bacterium]MBT4494969.1 pyridoxamine 5'-phosphate oxidase family protein [Gammaproteobacteria bacterium]
MANLSETERTRIRRAPTRSSDDAQELYRLLDEAYVCHVGFVSDGSPVVIPTLGWRVDDDIVFHGSRGSRMLKIIKAGGAVCVTFTLLDGLVMARSPFHHSANYRSAVIFGQPIVIEDRDEKLAALEVFMENIAPGRWDLLRETNKQEIEATDVLRLPLTEASLKIRAGDPIDDEEDLGHPIWAGVIPIHRQFGPTVDSKDNLPDQNPDDFSQVFKDAWTP